MPLSHTSVNGTVWTRRVNSWAADHPEPGCPTCKDASTHLPGSRPGTMENALVVGLQTELLQEGIFLVLDEQSRHAGIEASGYRGPGREGEQSWGDTQQTNSSHVEGSRGDVAWCPHTGMEGFNRGDPSSRGPDGECGHKVAPPGPRDHVLEM